MLYHSIQYERQWWSIRNWTMYRLDTSNNLTTSGWFKNFRNIQADHKKVKLFWLQRAVGFENRIISDGIMTSSLREFTLLRYYVITVADLGVCRVCGRTGPPHFFGPQIVIDYFLISTHINNQCCMQQIYLWCSNSKLIFNDHMASMNLKI